MRFSSEQLIAINTRGTNLLVSAAAGSGKTAVLVERILSLIEEGASLEEMLIVTFTRAAAAEMRARIQKALSERGKSARLRREYNAVPRAQIRTLHSFCEWMLRQYFNKADVPPSFRVDNGTLLLPQRQRALEEAIDAALKDHALSLARLCDIDVLPERVLQTHEFLQNQPDPEGFAQNALAQYRALCDDFDASPHAAVLGERREALFDDAYACVDRAMKICRMDDGPQHYLSTLEDDVRVIERMQGGDADADFGRLSSSRAECDPALKEAAQDLRKLAKDAANAARSLPDGNDERALARTREMLPTLEALLSLTLDFDRLYMERKLDAGLLEFSDLEHGALRTLRDAEVRESLRERFAHVFIDEYQDVNPLQEAVIAAVSREDNRFMVGDVKQSIYRFRQADPTIFLDTAARYADGEGGQRVDLNCNYRSAPHILDAVNHLFARVMTGGAAEIEYDERAMLFPGREEEAHEPAVEILLVETGGEAEDIAPEDADEIEALELSAAEMEAHAVAEAVLGFIGEPIPAEGGGTRPAKPGDIAILLRSPSGVAHTYARALEARGLTVAADVGGAIFTAPEVVTFLDLLRAIENRRNDLALLSALRNVGEFSSNDLALMRAAHTEGSFFDAASACAQGDGELSLRAAAFLARLLAWRESSRRMPLPDFLYLLLEETDKERIAGLSHRDTELTNLRVLCANAAAMPGATLGDFLKMAEQRQFADDDTSAGEPPASDNAVRLMSVHKSKGLEFPIVIGANLGRRLNLRDSFDDLLMSRRLGFGLRYKDETVSFRADTLARQAIRLEKEALSRAEELRILYVLLTRPRERLLLCAAVKNAEKAASAWATRDAELFSASCMMDWVGPTVLRHPDGEALRARATGGVNASAHPARYSVRVVRGLAPDEAAAGPELLSMREDTELPSQQDIDKLAYRYPFGDPTPQKTSVSASLGAGRPEPPPPERPAFLREERDLTPTQRGSAMHAALRAIDFAHLRGLYGSAIEREIERQLQEMLRDRLFTQEQYAALSPAAIAAFFESPIGHEALAADTLYREQPFNLRVGDGDLRLMQGIIDLCYIAPDGRWTVVDYKTDRAYLTPADVRERHGEQLLMYAKALEALTDREAGRMAVYLFANGKVVEISRASALYGGYALPP